MNKAKAYWPRTERTQAMFHYGPKQHNAHVKAFSQHVFEADRRWTRRLRGEEGPPPNFDPVAVAAVLDALRDGLRNI